MERLVALARRLNRYSLWFSGTLVLLAALIIGVDVILRKFFQSSIGGADELAGYSLALGTAWSLGAALMDRAHIRIDSLYGLFPRGLRLVLDLIGLTLFVGFFGLVGWRGLSVAEQSWISSSRSHTALATPTIIPQSIWLIGLATLLIIGIILFSHAIYLIQRGEKGAATKLIGTRAAAEEVEEEVRYLKEKKAKGAGD
ncbi:MAG: TRAP transporter small permease subunit [Thermodesulfobacteriota bacterium]